MSVCIYLQSLFGGTSAAQPGGLFGSTTTTASTGFGGFGQTQSTVLL